MIVVYILLGVILLPIVAYMVMKFGTAGYLRAKEQYYKNHKHRRDICDLK